MQAPEDIDTTPQVSPSHTAQVIQAHATLLASVAKGASGWYVSMRATAPMLSDPFKKALLVEGVDPGIRNTQGLDAFDIIGALDTKDAERANVVAARMALGLIDAGYPLLERKALSVVSLPLCKHICRQLHERKKKKGFELLDQDGGNICHWLARHDPLRFSQCLKEDALTLPSSWCFDRDSILQNRTSDGASVLHVLWSSPASGDLAANGDILWQITANLAEREKIGFDLAARDCDGVSVVELIHAAGALGACPSDQLRAVCENKLMELAAPQASSNRASPRL